MALSVDSKLLRIFIGESDKIGHKPLYQVIVEEAKKNNMAGCTVVKGIMSYGASTSVHSARMIEISSDLPVIVELVDFEDKINEFTKVAGDILDKAGCGGLITIEKASVLFYKPKSVK